MGKAKLDEINAIWKKVKANLDDHQSEENEALLDEILRLAEAHKLPVETAKVKLFRHSALTELPKKKQTAVEQEIRECLETCKAAGDPLGPALGYEALTRYYILAGDHIRADEFRAATLAASAKAGPLSVMVARFSIQEFWEKVTQQKKLSEAASPIKDFLADVKLIKTSSVKTRVGDYLTVDKAFATTVTRRVKELKHQIRGGLAKPENFRLQADPGSGKSFFVKQIAKQINDAHFMVHNLTGYHDRDAARDDIVLDILLEIPHHSAVISLIDEADTKFGDLQLYERFIAVMNGETFFFKGKATSFADVNLIFFFAMSSPLETVQSAPKGEDFLSRIPSGNVIKLPTINSSDLEKIYRAVAIIKSAKPTFAQVHARALYFVGLKTWASTRELELLLKQAIRRVSKGRDYIELGDFPVSAAEISDVQKSRKADIFGFADRIIAIE